MISRMEEKILKYPMIYFVIYFLFAIKPKIEFFYPDIIVFYKYFHYLLLLWGLSIMVYNYKFFKEFFTTGILKYSLLICVPMVITIFYNLGSITGESIKTILLSIFVMLLFLPAFKLLNRKYNNIQILKCILYPVIVFKGIISSISLYMYFNNISLFIIGENNKLYYAGLRYVRVQDDKFTLLLYGIYNDPNYGAVYSATIIVLAVAMLFFNIIKLNIARLLVLLFIIMEFIVLNLQNSRGIEVAVYISGVIIIVYNAIKYINKKIDKRILTKRIINLILILSLLFFGGKIVKFIGFESLNNTNNVRLLLVQNAGKLEEVIPISEDAEEDFSKYLGEDNILEVKEKKLENVSLEKTDSSKEYGNGRLTIWKDAIKLSTKSILFGIGPDMQKEFSKKYTELDVPTMKIGRSLHNSYIHLYLSFGLFGFTTLMYVFIDILKRSIEFEYKNDNLVIQVLLFVLSVVLISSVFLESIFININYQQMYMYFILGVICSKITNKNNL